jgi:acyl-[acyl-carrier-protein]-phospholipid O-acyltransferase / long-chain-fatty-acid--[acyl-carrier-protein] ligase
MADSAAMPPISPTEAREAAKARPTERPNWQRGFWSLIVTQFQNAFNDNALKFLVIYIIVAMHFTENQRDFLVGVVVSGLFAIPFLLFSMTGGYFADRYSKRSVVIGTKLMEVAVMLFAIASFALHSLPMECASVFLISTQSALFGPSKYGLLPEILPEKQLSWGNGIIELGTFLGSIAAVMASGYLAQKFRGREVFAVLIYMGCTAVGLMTSLGITRVPAADPARKFRWNPLADIGEQLKFVKSDRVLSWAVLGNSYLWFLAALLQLTIVMFGKFVLLVDERQISYLQIALSIGIGAGSLAAGYLSGGKIEYGLIPLGAVGMTLFGGMLYWYGQTMESSATILALLGFFGGFFAVPLNALIQHRPRAEHKGGVVAFANFFSFVGVLIAGLLYPLFSRTLNQSAWGYFSTARF